MMSAFYYLYIAFVFNNDHALTSQNIVYCIVQIAYVLCSEKNPFQSTV